MSPPSPLAFQENPLKADNLFDRVLKFVVDSVVANAFSYALQLIMMFVALWYMHAQVEMVKADAAKQIAEVKVALVSSIDSVNTNIDNAFNSMGKIKDAVSEKSTKMAQDGSELLTTIKESEKVSGWKVKMQEKMLGTSRETIK